MDEDTDMSIQMIVCTPLSFYTNYLRSSDPVRDVKIWYQRIREDTGVELPVNYHVEEYLCYDLSAWTQDCITEIIGNENKDLNTIFFADIILPVYFKKICTVYIPNYIKAANYRIVSTAMVNNVLPQVRTLVDKTLIDNNHDDALVEIDAYSRAIVESERVKQPIFFSY